MRTSSRTGVRTRPQAVARRIGGGLVGLAVGLVAVTVAGLATPPVQAGGAAGRPPTLRERADCGQAVSQPGSQIVTVIVPATVLLRVDHGGHVVAAATNTGCAPKPGDDLFYVGLDGTIEPAPTTQLAHRRWIGDFTTVGVFVMQQRG